MKKLDILFVHPNGAKIIYQDLANNYSAIEPPIWAGMLANHCRIKGFGVDLLDAEALHLTHEAAVEQIKKAAPRVACFVVYGQQPSASSQNMIGAIALAETVKEQAPDIKILFVGGHIAALSKNVLERHSCIDFVCQNEGVYTISNLLQTNLKDKLDAVDGLGWRNGGIVLNKPSPIVAKADLPA